MKKSLSTKNGLWTGLRLVFTYDILLDFFRVGHDAEGWPLLRKKKEDHC